MTKDEFNRTKFKAKMQCRCAGDSLKFLGDIYTIKGLDFAEGRIWLGRKGCEAGFWVSYQHIEIIKRNSASKN